VPELQLVIFLELSDERPSVSAALKLLSFMTSVTWRGNKRR